MENASKALLIAAAVLIVVLLIAFGMGIFNQATEAGDASAVAGELSSSIDAGKDAISSAVTQTQSKLDALAGVTSGS